MAVLGHSHSENLGLTCFLTVRKKGFRLLRLIVGGGQISEGARGKPWAIGEGLWYGWGVEAGRERMAAPPGENAWPPRVSRSTVQGRSLSRTVGKTIRSNEMLRV